MKCLYCNYENDDTLHFCENCGRPLSSFETYLDDNCLYGEEEREYEIGYEKPVTKKSHKALVITIIAVALFLGGSIGFLAISGIGGQMLSNITAGTSLESEESKEMEGFYQEGVSLMGSESYEKAIAQFAKISKSHYRYKDAKKNIEICSENYAKSIVTAIDDYQKDDDYENAYAMLEQANSEALEDNLALQDEMLKLQKKYKAFLLARVNEYKKNGDYAGALAELANCDTKILPEDKEVNAETKAVQDKYRQNLLAQAEALLKNEGYESAIACLKEGYTLLPNDTAIKEKIKEYVAYQPVLLYDLEYFNSGPLREDWTEDTSINISRSSHFDKVGTLKDNLGNEYADAIKTASTPNGSWESYKIDGKYTKITGFIVIDEKYKSADFVGYVKIFGDGIELYSSPKITKGTEPISFDVNVSGVDEMTIKMVRNWNFRSAHFALVNAKLVK